jgi:hypothetical protein
MSSVTDATQQGQAYRVIMLQTVVAAERIIRQTSHIKVNEVAAMLDVSRGSSHMICYSSQSVRKVGA